MKNLNNHLFYLELIDELRQMTLKRNIRWQYYVCNDKKTIYKIIGKKIGITVLYKNGERTYLVNGVFIKEQEKISELVGLIKIREPEYKKFKQIYRDDNPFEQIFNHVSFSRDDNICPCCKRRGFQLNAPVKMKYEDGQEINRATKIYYCINCMTGFISYETVDLMSIYDLSVPIVIDESIAKEIYCVCEMRSISDDNRILKPQKFVSRDLYELTKGASEQSICMKRAMVPCSEKGMGLFFWTNYNSSEETAYVSWDVVDSIKIVLMQGMKGKRYIVDGRCSCFL